MDRIFVAGVGMTRMGKLIDSTVRSLTAEAVLEALADAGIRREEIQSAFFSNATQHYMEGQTFVAGQIALRSMGFESIPVFNVENACASGATAFNLAAQFLRAGEGDAVLAVGAEKMFIADRERMFGVFDGGWDVSRVEENKRELLALGDGVEPPPGTMSDKPYSLFMDVYAAFSRFHMKRFGTTARQLAAISAKNHAHSVHNDKAQYRVAYSIDEVLAAPPIAYPLTLPMCAPISDGGAAAILCTEHGLKRLGVDRARAIELRASVVQTGSGRRPEDVEDHITAKAARRAYEIAGVGPEDVSVAEVHDATATGELIQSENLGFFPFGEGGAAAERGKTSIGGCIPINPSGGLESKGHPIGATGLGQVYELVRQLRGECGPRQVEGARIALAENGGGLLGIEEAAASVLILAR
jgi:acetyl-CoA acyltransferase